MKKKVQNNFTILFIIIGSVASLVISVMDIERVQRTFTYSDSVLSNPLTGYAPSTQTEELSEDIQLLYMDVTWKELEPEKGVYNWDFLEEKNQLKRWREEGKYVVLRFVLDYPQKYDHEDIPTWLLEELADPGDRYASSYGKGFSPNYADRQLIRYYRKAVTAMGKRWAASGQIAFIELGGLGHWGEWHVNREAGIRQLPEAKTREKYIAPWVKAFPEANLLMRRPFETAKKQGFGIYNDMVGHEASSKEWLGWIESGGNYDQEKAENGLVAMPDAWKTAPIGGEFTSSVSLSDILNKHRSQTLEELQQSHTTFLGPKIGESIDGDQTGYKEVLKHMGYRLWIPSAVIHSGPKKSKVEMTWENKGVAPFYRDWKTELYVLDASGNVIETKEVSIKLTSLLPNEKQTITVDLDTTDITKSEKGYKVAVAVISPMSKKPAIHFANKDQEKETLLTLYDASK